MPDGSYTYQVTAVFRSWTAAARPATSSPSRATPTPRRSRVAMTNASNAALVGSTIYFRNGAAGSFQTRQHGVRRPVRPRVRDFPAVTASGWTHAAETVSTGTGTNPITYTSSPFSWTTGAATPSAISVVGHDVGGNSVTTALGFAVDNTGPTGGALTVNGVAASAGGTTSAARAAFTIGVRTDYNADAGSGLRLERPHPRERHLQRQHLRQPSASPVTIIGRRTRPASRRLLPIHAHRHRHGGQHEHADHHGAVRRHGADPGGHARVPGGGYLNGTNLYVRTTAAGSFTLTSAVTDNQSGRPRWPSRP